LEILQKWKGLKPSVSSVLIAHAYLTSAVRLHRRFLSWDQAVALLRSLDVQGDGKDYESARWRYEHVLCSRVFDTWSISKEIMSIGRCYYQTIRPSDPDFIAYLDVEGHAGNLMPKLSAV
jgi:hypothetical protein